jgi:predicted permease
LRRTPVFTLTSTLTLVIGIAATVAIFAVVNGVLLRPLPYRKPDRLVGAWFDLPPLSMHHAQQMSATYFLYRRLAHTIDGIGVYRAGAVNVATPGSDAAPQRVTTAWVSASVISVLGVQPELGRNFTEAEDLPKGPDAVILSDTFWRTHFGADPQILGKRVEVNGVTRSVVGVMPEHFQFPTASTAFWLPLALDPRDPYSGGFNYNSVARLKAGVRIDDARREFTALLPRLVEVSPTLAPGVTMQMLLEQAKPQPLLVPLREDITSDIARTLWMVFAAAGLVMLVACFNVANLVLVRADARQRELAVREALGAGRARVLGHFLAESVVLTAIAGVVALGAAWAAVRALVARGPIDIPRLAEVRMDRSSIAFAVVLAVVVAIVCSVIPALRIGRLRLSEALRDSGRTGTAGRTQHRVRGALVAAQIGLGLVVLSGSGLLLRTFERLHEVRPGFDAEHVATFWVSLPDSRYKTDSTVSRFYTQLTSRAAQLPGVKTVGLAAHLPLESHGLNADPFYPESDPSYAKKIPPLQIYVASDSGYFGALGIPLLAGHGFDRLETQRDDEAIISQTTAEQFFHDPTGRAAIGKRFRELPNATPWRTVVGVVGNVRDTALAAPPSAIVYVPEVGPRDTVWRGLGHLERTMALVVRTRGDPAAITSAVQRVVRDLDPPLPTFDVRPMTDVVRASTARLSFVILILGAAAVVTLLLGAVGLYGVMAYLVTLRQRELGVRIALGAQPRAVAAMLTWQGLGLTAAGIVGGLALFGLVAHFLRSFLYGVTPSDPTTLMSASLMLVTIAALASWIPARRAAAVDPANTLRAE